MPLRLRSRGNSGILRKRATEQGENEDMKKSLFVLLALLLMAGLLPMATSVGASPGPGLVGLWHMDEVYYDAVYLGNITPDSSGNGNHGNLTNMDVPEDLVVGKFGNALDFDGVDDYVDCGNNSSLNITGNITLEAWIYPHSISTYQEFISKGDYGGPTNAFTYFFLIMDNGYVRFGINTGAAGDYVDSGAALPSANTWYHVAATFDPGSDNVVIYIDGAQSNTGTITNAPPSLASQPLYIGALKDGASTLNEFDGLIDEVRIWDQVLSADAIEQSYELGAPQTDQWLDTVQLSHQDLAEGQPVIFTSAFYLGNRNCGNWTIVDVRIMSKYGNITIEDLGLRGKTPKNSEGDLIDARLARY